MPAYNAAKTLKRTYDELPHKIIQEVILTDDESSDETVSIARELGLTVFIHPKNRGYGGNQKTCYQEALKRNPDIVVMVHPDYQYDPKKIPQLIQPIIDNEADIMLGSRVRSRQETLAGGMPMYKYIGNRFLTIVENIFLGLNLSEYHTGFRAYSAAALRLISFEKFSDDFVFDQEVLIAAVRKGLRIGEIAVPAKYFEEASSIGFWPSVRYGMMTLIALFR